MYTTCKLPPSLPHFSHGTIIQTGIQFVLYSHVFHTTVFALFKFKTLRFISKGPQLKYIFVNPFLVSTQPQKCFILEINIFLN